jgi:hypothetical protein
MKRRVARGFEIFRGMPGGGHSLAIFGHCMPVLCDEPVEYVEKDSVWLFHVDWLLCFTNHFWLIC